MGLVSVGSPSWRPAGIPDDRPAVYVAPAPAGSMGPCVGPGGHAASRSGRASRPAAAGQRLQIEGRRRVVPSAASGVAVRVQLLLIGCSTAWISSR